MAFWFCNAVPVVKNTDVDIEETMWPNGNPSEKKFAAPQPGEP